MKAKWFTFTEEREQKFNRIKNELKTHMGKEPPNTKILDVLLNTFDKNNPDIIRKPRSKDLWLRMKN